MTDEPSADDPASGEEPIADDSTDESVESGGAAEAAAPPPIREHLYALVEELGAHDGLLLALDFDGTLAEIESRPDEATLPEETREVVAALADLPDVEVAVVSGRELADVRERVAIPGVSYAGNHGLELRTGGEYEVHPTASEVEATIAELCETLREELDAIEGAIVEDKGVSATVHHRLVADDEVAVVRDAVERLVAASDDVRLTTGKDVLEIRPEVEWDKGEAVRWLVDQLVPAGERWLPVYVGDDTTDEAAFGVLTDHGLGVKVGDDPETHAPYRVADPERVRAVLSWLGTYGVEFLRSDSDESPTGTP